MAENGRRRERDRLSTERDLLDAAWKLFERDGPLRGLNLNEVAEAAGANRASIYHYFGSRENLLRAALGRRLEELRPIWLEDRKLPFVDRRLHGFDVVSSGNPTLVKLVALLILENAPSENPLVLDLDRARETISENVTEGSLPEDTDVDFVHLMPLMTYLGFALLRDWIRQELDIEYEEVDDRARAVFKKMLEGLTATDGSTDEQGSSDD